jgi:hypothetical protein
VSNGQRVYPAAELSEQISTAGKEASGTGNMKFSMNGALTIGTMDGANIEIREEVGAENFFLFGLTAEQVAQTKARGYRPQEHLTDELKEVVELVGSGFFSRGDSQMFRPLLDGLLWHDPYLALADFASYSDCQQQVSDAYRDVHRWTRMSILNAARSGKFSSDRTIQEYCSQIWKAPPVPIRLLSQEDVKVGFMQHPHCNQHDRAGEEQLEPANDFIVGDMNERVGCAQEHVAPRASQQQHCRELRDREKAAQRIEQHRRFEQIAIVVGAGNVLQRVHRLFCGCQLLRMNPAGADLGDAIFVHAPEDKRRQQREHSRRQQDRVLDLHLSASTSP